MPETIMTHMCVPMISLKLAIALWNPPVCLLGVDQIQYMLVGHLLKQIWVKKVEKKREKLGLLPILDIQVLCLGPIS